jgi:hypothetical protein
MEAQAVIAGVPRNEPKFRADKFEMIRRLKMTKDSTKKGRTQVINQIKALVITAPI